MNIDEGPCRIDRLPTHCKVADFQLNDAHSALLIASAQRQLQSYYLKNSIQASVQSRILPMTSLDVNCVPELFSFSGNKNIVHCDGELLVLNNKKELAHKEKIRHLLIDDFQIALTTCLDTIHISSVEKGVFLGQLRSFGDSISALFWNNSLVASGDERGTIKLWDINKQLAIHSSCFYNSKIDLISSYVDFIHTNLYYSYSKQEKKIAFHDLRTYRPIKITSTPSDVGKIIHNQSGKIFMLSPNNIHLIDIYHSYNIMGAFSELKGEHLDHFMIKYPQAQSYHRSLNDIISWHQYVIAGCDNGCIEVYNSDTFQCMYGYGLCESSGIRKLMSIDHSLLALEEKGILCLAQFA